jgi:U-box domain
MSSTHAPQHLICPIALELFVDPVTVEDGNTYERDAISQWIHQHGTSPITKKPMKIDRLIPNHSIKDSVANLKQQQRRENGEQSTPISSANANR